MSWQLELNSGMLEASVSFGFNIMSKVVEHVMVDCRLEFFEMVNMDDTVAFWIVSCVTLYVRTDPLIPSVFHLIIGGQLPRKDTLHHIDHNVCNSSERVIFDASLTLQLGGSSEIKNPGNVS